MSIDSGPGRARGKICLRKFAMLKPGGECVCRFMSPLGLVCRQMEMGVE